MTDSEANYMDRRISQLKAECERLRAREAELVAALERAGQDTVDTVTEERRLLSAECERLRARAEVAEAEAFSGISDAKLRATLLREHKQRDASDAECERLRAALAQQRTRWELVVPASSAWGLESEAEASIKAIDAALAGAPAEPPVTREQERSERALAILRNGLYLTIRSGTDSHTLEAAIAALEGRP